MGTDQDLQRMIDADIEDWKARKHEAVFNIEGGEGCNDLIGSLWIDGKPLRPGSMVANHWVSLTEAKSIAGQLGVTLKVA